LQRLRYIQQMHQSNTLLVNKLKRATFDYQCNNMSHCRIIHFPGIEQTHKEDILPGNKINGSINVFCQSKHKITFLFRQCRRILHNFIKIYSNHIIHTSFFVCCFCYKQVYANF
jgi:hypothetical protein